MEKDDLHNIGLERIVELYKADQGYDGQEKWVSWALDDVRRLIEIETRD